MLWLTQTEYVARLNHSDGTVVAMMGCPRVCRESRRVGGRLLHVAVYECWGDLRFEAYEPRRAAFHSTCEPLHAIVGLLSDEPRALALYLLCVRANRYASELMRVLLDRLDLALPAEASAVSPTPACSSGWCHAFIGQPV